MSYRYIPELDNYFQSYWISRGEITIDNISIPEVAQAIPTGSFLELLFCQIFDSTTYTYLFSETTTTSFAKDVRERLQVSHSTITSYISTDSTSGENIFSLVSDDLTMLNKLLEYRKGNSPLLTNIDYDDLSTNLSKLIYTYLDLVINNNYSILNTSSKLSTEGNLLENLFEEYVVNESYKTMKNWSSLIDAKRMELRVVHEVIHITDDIETAEEVVLRESTYNYDVTVFLNGVELVENTDYTIMIDSTSEDSTATVTWIVWEDNDAVIIEGDVLVAEYYTKINTNDTGTPFIDNEEYVEGG
jgi:hypothetical protein